jgi:hypothetical protein
MTEPNNEMRADWAQTAADAFAEETFGGRTFTETLAEQPDFNGDARCMISDLIADLLHLAKRSGWDPYRILEIGRDAFNEEVAEEASR